MALASVSYIFKVFMKGTIIFIKRAVTFIGKAVIFIGKGSSAIGGLFKTTKAGVVNNIKGVSGHNLRQ